MMEGGRQRKTGKMKMDIQRQAGYTLHDMLTDKRKDEWIDG